MDEKKLFLVTYGGDGGEERKKERKKETIFATDSGLEKRRQIPFIITMSKSTYAVHTRAGIVSFLK